MIDLQDLRSFAAELGDSPVLSVYLNVDAATPENQATTAAWQIALKNQVRAIGDQAETSEHAGAWSAVRAALDTFTDGYTTEGHRGLALFVSPDTVREYRLPVAPEENAVHWGRAAFGPLLWLIDEYEPYVIALVDREKAHFMTGYLGGTVEGEQIQLDLEIEEWREKTRQMSTVPGADGGYGVGGGNNLEVLEDKIDEYLRRFYREVGTRIGEMMQKHGADRLILGGDQRAAHALKEFLPGNTAEQVVAVLAIPLRSSPRQIMEQVLDPALEYERQREAEIVTQVIDLAKSGGRGALGHAEVQRALDEGRVELLVMTRDLESSLQHALARQVLDNGALYEIVHGEAADRLRQEGGLGARLYYAYPAPNPRS